MTRYTGTICPLKRTVEQTKTLIVLALFEADPSLLNTGRAAMAYISINWYNKPIVP